MKFGAWLKDLALLPDIVKIRRQFRRELGAKIDLRHPVGFNEKIQWYKLYWRDPLMTICADKVKVRDYVAERIGPQILNELYGVYADPAEIDFDKLPSQFVFKANHSSGQNIFCPNLQTFDRQQAIKQLTKYLQFNHYKSGREWAYKHIPRRIICEKYLEQNGSPPIDYKFFCFHGQPAFIQVDCDRFADHQRTLYDLDWKVLPFRIRWPQVLTPVDRPPTLPIMLDIAKKLSTPFPFVRVDLYSLQEKVVFGELTFYPGSGYEMFIPYEWDICIGEKLNIPNEYPINGGK